jgi:antitoxin component of MazEF toxin-antitoxin module
MTKLRKVIKTGHSLAVTLPNEVIKFFGIKEGDVASFKIKRTKNSITYIFPGHPHQLSIDL